MKLPDAIPEGAVTAHRMEWKEGHITEAKDLVIEEIPVALTYNGIAHVVMMCTPCNLRDFALGFSLSEGIIEHSVELLDVEVVQQEKGIELCLTILAKRFEALKSRRGNMTGRTGCGLCGAESLEQVILPVEPVRSNSQIADSAIDSAICQIKKYQILQQMTGAAHAAAWCDQYGNIVLLREDVGRHNALDKLLGAIEGAEDISQGFALITSRASFEMVVKAARFGISVLVAVSAPTSLAIAMALQYNVTLIAFTQRGRHVNYFL